MRMMCWVLRRLSVLQSISYKDLFPGAEAAQANLQLK